MGYWQLHALNARHGLTLLLPQIRAAAAEAVAAVEAHQPLPPFDLVVRADTGIGNSEWGLAGSIPSDGVIELALDPQRFSAPLAVRTLTHHIMHLLRQERLGPGRSLGDALVSEGIAGHFVVAVLGGPADPWNLAPVAQNSMKRAITEWSWPRFDHGEWFLGRGKLRRWTGNALGYQLVAAYLAQNPDETALSLADAGTDVFRPTLRTLVGGEAEPEDLRPPAEDIDNAAETAAHLAQSGDDLSGGEPLPDTPQDGQAETPAD